MYHIYQVTKSERNQSLRSKYTRLKTSLNFSQLLSTSFNFVAFGHSGQRHWTINSVRAPRKRWNKCKLSPALAPVRTDLVAVKRDKSWIQLQVAALNVEHCSIGCLHMVTSGEHFYYHVISDCTGVPLILLRTGSYRAASSVDQRHTFLGFFLIDFPALYSVVSSVQHYSSQMTAKERQPSESRQRPFI